MSKDWRFQGHPDTHAVKILVCSQEQYDEGKFLFDGPLDDVIASLVEMKELIPVEHRCHATCEIGSVSGWEDSHYASIEVVYWRPPTEAEVAERANRRLAKLQAEEDRERAAYELLRRKFGP